jgi:hypothetical protein
MSCRFKDDVLQIRVHEFHYQERHCDFSLHCHFKNYSETQCFLFYVSKTFMLGKVGHGIKVSTHLHILRWVLFWYSNVPYCVVRKNKETYTFTFYVYLSLRSSTKEDSLDWFEAHRSMLQYNSKSYTDFSIRKLRKSFCIYWCKYNCGFTSRFHKSLTILCSPIFESKQGNTRNGRKP